MPQLWQIIAAFAASASAISAALLFAMKTMRLHAREQILEMLRGFATRDDLNRLRSEIMEELRYLRERLDRAIAQNERKSRLD